MMLRLTLSAILVLASLVMPGAILGASAQTNLVVWIKEPTDLMGFEAGIGPFKAAYPNINVEFQHISGSNVEFMEKLQVAIAAGTPPDVTWVAGGEVKEFAFRGMLTDLTRVLEGIQFNPGDTEEATFQGRLWGMPYRTVVRGLFKRVDALESVGIDSHSNPEFDELEAWNRRLTLENPDGSYARVGFVPWYGNWSPAAWIWTFGGELVDESGTLPTANHPRNVAAFEWIETWAHRYGNVVNPIDPGDQRGFIVGTLAMFPTANVVLGPLLDADVDFTVGRVPHPPGGRNGTWGGGDVFAIPSGVENVDAAQALVRHLASADAQMALFMTTLQHGTQAQWPANVEALRSAIPYLPAQAAPLIDQFAELNPRTPIWLTYLQRLLRPAERAVVTGEKTPQQALDDVQREIIVHYQELFR